VDGEKIATAFNDGLLEIQIPKKESAKPRTIAVELKKKLPAAA
jgi:HSP20 family molecular chaperone IbpA